MQEKRLCSVYSRGEPVLRIYYKKVNNRYALKVFEFDRIDDKDYPYEKEYRTELKDVECQLTHDLDEIMNFIHNLIKAYELEKPVIELNID